MNKFLFALMVLMLVFALVDKISSITSYGYLSPGIAPLKVAELIGLLLMLYNGTLRITRFYSYFLFGFLLIILGGVMKIMHLPGADEMIIVSFPAMMIVYMTHFIMKKQKILLDYFKVLFVIVFIAITPLTVLHLIDDQMKEIILIVNHTLYWITFALFLYEEGYRKKALF